MVRIFLLLIFCFTFRAQEDLLALVGDKPVAPKHVFATFKTFRLGNAQTTETVKKNHLDFRIAHRFGNLYDNTLNNPLNAAAQNMFGFDVVEDIRFSLDYGITDDITLGIGRSRMNKLIDGCIKWRFLKQTTDFKIPVTLTFFGDIGYSHAPTTKIYEGVIKDFSTNELHRLNYASQLIIASKINNSFSLLLLPTYIHRNYVRLEINTHNQSEIPNSFFSLGMGARIKITKRVSIIGDYFQNLHAFYFKNKDYNMPLALGVEAETGGHVFSLFFTNASGLIENNFISITKSNWANGQVKFGFNISRTFSLGR
ncbi:MAG: DUF5777 family beta-barrel protein [Bacteroidia bacterium]|nr:DUF5777 family beta-barrel protein [Bacteroidia bacterium]